MIGVRVTKIICPSCKGSGECELFNLGPEKCLPCMWCRGAKRLDADKAEHYADNLYSIAVGGYVCGDHDIADMERMEAEAAKVFALLQRKPTWLRSPSDRAVEPRKAA